MASMSNYLENALLNAVLRGVAYTSPAKVYLALYTSDPTDADTGTEVSGGSYARQEVAFSAPTDGSASNSAEIKFPVCTADWGTVTHVGVRDASPGGNLLYHAAADPAKPYDAADQFVMGAGTLTLQHK